jgi:hypothetical protein
MALLSDQPMCAFCGGDTAATTIDHQPARSLFDQKQWPEGYEFPACYACNQASRRYENVMALLVRINPDEETSAVRQREVRKYISAMGNNFPDLLTILSTSEKRQFFKEEGLAKPPNTTYSELGMAGIEAGLAEEAIEFFFRKLFRALHYKHTGKIVPTDAGIFLRWYTNAYTHRTDELNEFTSALRGRPLVVRNGRSLADQFFYAYGLDPNVRGLSAFSIYFRSSLMAFGMLSFDPSLLEKLTAS